MKNISQSALFQRATLLLGRDVMEHVAAVRVIVFGLGGVGSWCAEALVRTGFRRLTIVDSDTICVTNINRQAQATSMNIGEVKTDELRKRLLEINPQAEITALRTAFDDQTCDQFELASYDYIVDAIDSLSNKVLLIERAVRSGRKCYSSMGAAARLDPSLIRTGPISETDICPLARQVRRGLRRMKVPLEAVNCVYSLESPIAPTGNAHCGSSACLCAVGQSEDAANFPDWCAQKARINGAVVHMTAIFGLTLAGLIVRDAVASVQVKPETVEQTAQ